MVAGLVFCLLVWLRVCARLWWGVIGVGLVFWLVVVLCLDCCDWF